MGEHYLAFALVAILVISGQSQECQDCDGSTVEINKSRNLSIYILSEVYEINNSTRTVFNIGHSESSKKEMFKILVGNSGDEPLHDIKVYGVMAKGMKFVNTAYYEAGRGKLYVKRDPIDFNEKTETKLEWDIGTLAPSEMKSILLEADLKPEVNNTDLDVTAIGYTLNDTQVYDFQIDAKPRLCVYGESDDGLVAPFAPLPGSVMICPDWIIS